MKIWGAGKHFFTTPRIVNFVSSHVISSFHYLLFMTWTWIKKIYIYIILYLRIYIYIYTLYLHAIHTCTHTYTRTCIDMQNMQSSARWEKHGEHEQHWGYDFGNCGDASGWWSFESWGLIPKCRDAFDWEYRSKTTLRISESRSYIYICI